MRLQEIQEQMGFIGFKDFCKRRKTIKGLFFELDRNDRYIYKLYIYSNRLINEDTADAIWEYLHDDISETQLKKFYKKVRV